MRRGQRRYDGRPPVNVWLAHGPLAPWPLGSPAQEDRRASLAPCGRWPPAARGSAGRASGPSVSPSSAAPMRRNSASACLWSNGKADRKCSSNMAMESKC